MVSRVKVHYPSNSLVKDQTVSNPEKEAKNFLSKEIQDNQKAIDDKIAQMPKEYGGRPTDKGKEPTRYGDWEFKGRCIDF